METILQFKNLDYYYESNGKNVAILDNVNFSFQKGHFYTILETIRIWKNHNSKLRLWTGCP